MSKMQKMLKHSPDPPASSFTNTWIGKDQVSYTYLTYKWMLAILFLVGLVQSIIQNTATFLRMEQTENVYKYFIYLTNNGRLVACAATTLEAVLVTMRFAKEKFDQNVLVVDENSLPPAMKLLWALCNINSSLSVMITLVYWITLYNPERHHLEFENFSGHLLIALANVLDVFISDRPWRILHAIHPIIFGGVFGIFSFIYFLAGGTNYYFEPYVYHIIDWAHPLRTLLVIGGVTVFLIVFHSFFYLLYRARLICSRRLRKRKEVASNGLENNINQCGLLEAGTANGELQC